MNKSKELSKYEQISRERIRDLIKLRCNGNQKEFAQRTGLNTGSVSQYVNGKNTPSSLTAKKIAAAFDLSPEWVMGFSNGMSSAANTPSPSTAATPALSPDREELLANYDKLNDEGKQDARKYVKLLGNSPEYTEDAEDTGNGNITA